MKAVPAPVIDTVSRIGDALLARGVLSGVLLMIGCGMAVSGVYMLAGAAWALLAGAVPLLAVGGVLLRGDLRE